ncbi:hypothetical protein PCANC_17332 [Puccinia coronata f. sp. avenae]|uniref:Uncharacterized protein n=1 Tax=Puccinia coronata f. sp. avenae TaxID=200324 RepID=A0A2N5S374_9BASI|nr:hypothetical protein PCASD_26417 [Puccinia coronata f. sp. avenae]PLW17193.1 hypothetical protein PCANC_16239 [Puccinia coronata f. sp. avenae]PLW37040.1 hypothetical protein PCASD_16345 [Puccinia coronata f. sp. avenae]PLW41335.1 hypothetical protein PCANC_17332 [Puccinia coronata f. sp. avenae]
MPRYPASIFTLEPLKILDARTDPPYSLVNRIQSSSRASACPAVTSQFTLLAICDLRNIG